MTRNIDTRVRQGCLLIWVFVLLTAARPSGAQSNAEKTLASFRKLDDFPLYVMEYDGDYGFAEYLKTGVRPSTDAEAPGGETAAWAEETAGRPEGAPWFCSCFAVSTRDGRVLVGRNFDWRLHPALLLFTRPPKAFASVSMVDISYLGFGRGAPSEENMRSLMQAPFLPFDGLNERGLAVTMMAVPDSEGGRDPNKVTIDSLAVIRLMLDYADGVDKAIELLGGYNVDFGGGPPIHYLIADKSGKSAVIEFLDDKMRVMRGDGSFQVSTNFLQFPGPPRNGRTGCWRYNRIFEALSRAEGDFSAADGLDLLRNVSQTGDYPTIWSCLYDLSARDLRVVMGRNFDRVHHLSLSPPSGSPESR
jgi:hypothetical protein